MLTKDNFTEEHIRSLQSKSRRDPLLPERCVYAFGLLEAITRLGMPFVFKGGTSLILILLLDLERMWIGISKRQLRFSLLFPVRNKRE